MLYLGIINAFFDFVGKVFNIIGIIILITVGLAIGIFLIVFLCKLVKAIVEKLKYNRNNRKINYDDSSYANYNSPDENTENTTEVEIPIEETKSIIHQVTYTFPIKPKNNGKKFEAEVNAQLDLLPKDIYTVYSNTWIPSSYYEKQSRLIKYKRFLLFCILTTIAVGALSILFISICNFFSSF